MMKAWEHFFRTPFEPSDFVRFGPLHLGILCLVLLGMIIIWRYNPPWARWVIWSMQALEQLTLKTWITFVLADPVYSLPLHTCSMGTLSVLITLFRPIHFFNVLVVYYGYFGGVLALIVATPMDYQFPHLTNITYFLGHTALLWAATWIHRNNRGLFSLENLKKYLIFHNLFLTLALLVDLSTGANYAYFNRAPVLSLLFASLAKPLYIVLVYAVYNVLPIMIYTIFREDKNHARSSDL